MNHFGSAVQRLFSTSDNDLTNNNILETAHHSQPVFEKIDPAKYFRITVSINRNWRVFLFMDLMNSFVCVVV